MCMQDGFIQRKEEDKNAVQMETRQMVLYPQKE